MPSSASSQPIRIPTTPLTPTAFAPFGTVVSSALPPSTTTIPTTPPPGTTYANQQTALKTPNISPLTSAYRLSPSGAPASPTLSLFTCFPRRLYTSQYKKQIYDVKVLERHPYTTQTFIPLASTSAHKSYAVIIVAPTLPSPAPPAGVSLTPYFPQARPLGPPDLNGLRAFMAEEGMGVCYGVGTWHAPMVVVGEGRMDFVVAQWISGREGEDCEEVGVGEMEGGVEVEVNVDMDGERRFGLRVGSKL